MALPERPHVCGARVPAPVAQPVAYGYAQAPLPDTQLVRTAYPQPAVARAAAPERVVYRPASERRVVEQPKRSVKKSAVIIGIVRRCGAGIGAIVAAEGRGPRRAHRRRRRGALGPDHAGASRRGRRAIAEAGHAMLIGDDHGPGAGAGPG